MNNEIVPLVSFPKSGNTWMRFILSNIFKRDENFKINFKTINDISSTSHSEDHSKMISLLKEDAPLFIKEHYSYYDMPYHNFTKAIYIYRDGFDTLLSYWYFRNAQSPNKYPNIETFSQYYWSGYGHWGEHVYSWLKDKNTNNAHKIFAISYEELIKNPVITIENCLKFLEYDIGREKIEEAINLSSKENMKQMSGSASFMKSKDKNFHFVRSTDKNQAKEKLPKYCKDEFMKYKINYELMLHYKYISSDNEWENMKKIDKNTFFTIIKNKYYNFKYRFFNNND